MDEEWLLSKPNHMFIKFIFSPENTTAFATFCREGLVSQFRRFMLDYLEIDDRDGCKRILNIAISETHTAYQQGEINLAAAKLFYDVAMRAKRILFDELLGKRPVREIAGQVFIA